MIMHSPYADKIDKGIKRDKFCPLGNKGQEDEKGHVRSLQ